MPSVRIEGINELRHLFEADVYEKASRRTVNDLTRQGKTVTKKKIRVRYTIKAGELEKKMKVTVLRASGSGQAKITTSSKGMPLTAFAGTRQTSAGVSVKLKHNSPRTVIHQAFLATMLSSGHEGAYRRRYRRLYRQAPVGRVTGGFARLPKKYRLPIEQIYSLAVPDMFDHQDVYDEVQALVDAKYETIFRRNFAFYAGQP